MSYRSFFSQHSNNSRFSALGMLFYNTLLTPRLLHSDFRKLGLFLTYMSIYLTTQKQHRLIRLTGK